MKISRPLTLVASICSIVLVTNLINFASTTSRFSLNYPPVVCPPAGSGLTSAISLASTKVPLRTTGSKTSALKPSQSTRYIQKSNPAIIDAQGATPVAWQFKQGKWAGAAICSSSNSSQWFVGGSADVTSQGKLILVNSGLSGAVADIDLWTETGIQTSKSVTLKSDSFQSIGLDSLAPGSQNLAIHVQTRSGRLNSFMVDERGRGLRALGGDLVNSTENPSKILNIPAIPHLLRTPGKKSSALSHTLRILNPGEVSARIDVEVISTDGTFIPVGFESREIANGKVLALKLDPNMPSGKFGIRISSDQPIVASVYSQTSAQGKSDFIWSTPASELEDFRLAVTGLSPQLVFMGNKINVTLELFYTNGKRKEHKIIGEEIAVFQVPDGVRVLELSGVSEDVYAGALATSPNGYGYFPLSAGSALTKASIPTSNIRVLTP
jgi:hypothetical protein